MMFIKPLHDIECLLGGKAKPSAGIPLKLRQVIKCWSVCMLLLFLHTFQKKAFSLDHLRDLFCPLSVKDTGAAGLLILPGKADPFRIEPHTIVGLWRKGADLLLPVCK